MSHNLKNAAHRIARLQDPIHFLLHTLLDVSISAIEQNFVASPQFTNLLPGDFLLPQGCIADGSHMAQHLDPELP